MRIEPLPVLSVGARSSSLFDDGPGLDLDPGTERERGRREGGPCWERRAKELCVGPLRADQSARSARYTLTLMTCSLVTPASARTLLRFWSVCSSSGRKPPSTTFPSSPRPI